MHKDVGTVSVLLISSTRLPSSSIRKTLGAAPDVELAEQVASFDDAATHIESVDPDVILADIGDFDDGPDRIQSLRSTFPDIHVIAISTVSDPLYAERTLRAGALGYLSTSTALPEIPEAIRSVARQKAYVNKRVARKILAHLMRVPSDQLHARLTEREREVFDLMKTLDVDQIADGLGLNARTVRGYCRSIRTKLDLTSTAELIEYARQGQSEQA